MSRFQHPTVDKLNYLQKLSSAEKLVLDVIAEKSLSQAILAR
ncbi:hypothetical protein O9H85_07335 [Paenibacillus filicis]|uniref:Uncharacterized protein n=1 Tax=Paenibacillus gyeongsangnamensis TaxID=3388067 RepID=A0ABT4Q5T2_9BACL|nr:hypothetical protein [Paenibacillus filicis]MCZ8512243.1 hypothetical protein [Paenibacillus filicis]